MPDRGASESDVSLRLDTLEAMYHEFALQRDERDRLVTGVERLTGETAGLNAILTRVDEQQRGLVAVDKKIEEVDLHSVSYSDLEAERESIRRESKRRARRFGTFLTLAVVSAGIILGFFALKRAERLNDETRNAAYQSCLDRNDQTEAQIRVLDGILAARQASDGLPPREVGINESLASGIKNLRELQVDCMTLYQKG